MPKLTQQTEIKVYEESPFLEACIAKFIHNATSKLVNNNEDLHRCVNTVA